MGLSRIGLAAYIYSLDSMTTYQYLYYATSTVLKHSLSGTISTAQAIVIAVGKPFMAKLADVIGRAEAFVVVTFLYVIGYIIIVSASTIEIIALGEIVYAFGFTGLQILQQIVIADMTTLRYRGFASALVSAPYLINNFVSAELLERVLPNWYVCSKQFAILVPLFLVPLIAILFWGQRQAKQVFYRQYGRSLPNKRWYDRLRDSFTEMDLVGLLLVGSSLCLILLPLGLAPQTAAGWKNPKMGVMIVCGMALLPLFILYEYALPARPVMPMRWLRRAPILGACLIGFFDFVSFYLQQTYLYSFVLVVEPDWSYRDLTYFSAIQSLGMTVFGIVAGVIMWATRRFKYMLFCGLVIRLIGVTLMIKARSSSGNSFELIFCQILQGFGGGFAAIATQVSAQAAVSHADVATVTALVLLLTEVGNSVGSAAATAIWNACMPNELRRYVPTDDERLLKELFGSITDIAKYPRDDPIRLGAIAAYQAVMYKLVLAAVIVAIIPPIFCLILIRNVSLARAQNALDNKDLDGLDPDDMADPAALRESADWDEGRVRLSPRSPARVLSFSAGCPGGKGFSKSERDSLLRSSRRSLGGSDYGRRLASEGGGGGGGGSGIAAGHGAVPGSDRVRLSPRNSVSGLRDHGRSLGALGRDGPRRPGQQTRSGPSGGLRANTMPVGEFDTLQVPSSSSRA
ncbi:major facilitator superfamily domain-containing protein [Kockovaella imperatae]|uniref:Major facilitator superfamily domain-containing protein n=1 Tax=Kockovaella imperatae TaxID=4999 RepID=A0A1Y1UAZ3_9TREE|nr:major facilitator superfamily domain-containing protein [Kockovaella imperatae]ORX34245.1 major facilitator superfamily domain-containing protein [Kockovaella imperatae]